MKSQSLYGKNYVSRLTIFGWTQSNGNVSVRVHWIQIKDPSGKRNKTTKVQAERQNPMWLVNTAFNSTLVWQCLLLTPTQCMLNVECVYIVYTTPMSFKCWPVLFTMARHQTNARYTDTYGQWWACVAYTGTML